MTPDNNQPSIIVIFGVTGDLARRFLLPSLYHLIKQGRLHEKTEIVGISRRPLHLDYVFNTVEICVNEVDKTCDPVALAHMHSRTRVRQMDMSDPASFHELKSALDAIEEEQGVCMDRLFYLAIPPEAYAAIIGSMGAAGLNGSCRHDTASSRLLVEKPFGQDLASARQLIDVTASSFSEEQVFRIDHYLAKETAQNILTFRFENPMFEAVWNNRQVSSIDIVASEKIGVEGRHNLYEQQGALRDFIQNHLLQLLAIATMDQPERFDSETVHRAKLALLERVRPLAADEVSRLTRRGQYDSYRQEAGNPDSLVETFAAVTTTIDSPRWEGVPVTIRTGKAMADKRTSITFTFTDTSGSQSNNLTFRIQPDEGIAISLLAKKPGFEHELQPVTMEFTYAGHFQGQQPSAYERVLVDAIRGDRTLFASSQEILAAWRIIDQVVAVWAKSGDGLQTYAAGTSIDEL